MKQDTSASARTVRIIRLTCLVAVLLAGCAVPDLRPAPVAAGVPSSAGTAQSAAVQGHTQPIPRALDDADRAEIRRLLQAGEYALADGQLTEPPTQSALGFYDRVLAMDPDNEQARHGIEAVVERLVLQARQAASARRFRDAERVLAQAFLVDPDHPAIRPALTEVRLLAGARRAVVPLEPRELDTRSPAMRAILRDAGRAGRLPGCRVIIRARNDAEGRWIYQEMSAAPGRERIRAELQVAPTPGIESICFEGDGT